ncbi:YveK family protein [Microterricola pindariensis]|uniref:Polysaccharide chain length determinant N-terminal domain-containing protein n=1 Tax=Microterricola pindariensis TaxID=478010 RepID=A0ABX5AYB5_9MICO|nr:hypothetical protein [Microterricola pindariensis]PPL19882.1 hypothetical protein GY24_03780 [Microterricola pindariensis]
MSMSEPLERTALGLDYYGFVLRRQWSVIALGAVLGILAALAYLVITPATVTATADVNINIISTDPFNTTKQASNLLDASTEMQIATSYSVAQNAAEALQSGADPADVRRQISASAVTGAPVVHISFTAPTSAQAQAGADAAATAYLAYRTTQAQTKLDSILKGVGDRRVQLGAELADANSRISTSAPGSSAANQAISDRDLVTIELNALLSQKSMLEQIDTAGGSILTTAARNDVVFAPSRARALGIGALAGLVLGMIVAFAINPLDRRLRNSREIHRATGAEILADIQGVDAVIPERETTLEQLRMARERIMSGLPQNAKTLTLLNDTSAGHPDVPANLASVMAEGGAATELILPDLPAELRLAVCDGLRLVLAHADERGDLYQSATVPTLQVYFPLPVTEDAAAPYIAQATWDRIEGAAPGTFHILALGAAAPPSSVLGALRISDCLAIIATAHRTRADTLVQVLTEAARIGTVFLGIITVSHRRHMSVAPHPASAPADTGSAAPTGHRSDSRTASAGAAR